jgi:hypothetical protein
VARAELIHGLNGGTTYVTPGRAPVHVRLAEQGTRMNWIMRLWNRIAQPRVQRFAHFVLYIFHLIAGAAIILGQPTDIAGLSGEQTLIWGIFLVIGGVIGAVSVLPGWNFFERVGITSIMVAIAIYSVALVTHPAVNPPVRVAFWCFITAWLVVFALRAWEIRRYLIAPTG